MQHDKNLQELVNSGEGLFFDCPQIDFAQNENFRESIHQRRYTLKDKNGKEYDNPPSPKMCWVKRKVADEKGIMHEEEVLIEKNLDEELGIEQYPVRSPYWSFLSHTMLDWKNRDDAANPGSPDEATKNKPQSPSALSEGENTDEIRSNDQKLTSTEQYKKFYGINKLRSAFEGGHRLMRRDKNIAIAFTYGFKLEKLSSLDIHDYKEQKLAKMKRERAHRQSHYGTQTKGTPVTATPEEPGSQSPPRSVDRKVRKLNTISSPVKSSLGRTKTLSASSNLSDDSRSENYRIDEVNEPSNHTGDSKNSVCVEQNVEDNDLNMRTEVPICGVEHDDLVEQRDSPKLDLNLKTINLRHAACKKQNVKPLQLKKRKILKVQEEFARPNFLDELEVAIDRQVEYLAQVDSRNPLRPKKSKGRNTLQFADKVYLGTTKNIVQLKRPIHLQTSLK